MTAIQSLSLYIHYATPTSAFYVLCLLLVGALLFERHKRLAILFTGGVIVMSAAVIGLKQWLAVPRPDNALVEMSTYAFPSAHATSVMFLAVALIFILLLIKTDRLPAINLSLSILLIAILIGLSRVFIKVHTLTQVLAGFVLGALVALVFFYPSYRRKRRASTQ